MEIGKLCWIWFAFKKLDCVSLEHNKYKDCRYYFLCLCNQVFFIKKNTKIKLNVNNRKIACNQRSDQHLFSGVL